MTTSLPRSIADIATDATQRAEQIIARTEGVRKEIQAGRPNCSSESTTEGVLKAFECLVKDFSFPQA